MIAGFLSKNDDKYYQVCEDDDNILCKKGKEISMKAQLCHTKPNLFEFE